MKKKRRLLQSDLLWAGAALLLIILQFWWLPGEDGSAGDSYSNTIDGKLGLYRILTQLCQQVERDVSHIVPKASDATMVLIAPDRYPTDAEQQEMYNFVINGGNLLFAPRWLPPEGLLAAPDSNERVNEVRIPSLSIRISPRSWLEHMVAAEPSNPVPPSNGAASDAAQTEGSGLEKASTSESLADTSSESGGEASKVTPAGTPSDPAELNVGAEEEQPGTQVTVQGAIVSGSVEIRTSGKILVPTNPTSEILLTSGNGDVEAATWNVGRGRVVVCSTADVFSNRCLLLPAERRVAIRLVERATSGAEDDGRLGDARIVIAEYYNASDAWQNTGILFSPAMRIGMLQLLLVTVLSIWMSFHRFGPAQDVATQQRRSLTESAEAVGNLQYRLRDGGGVIRGYLEYMRSQLRRRYGSLLRLEQPDQIANRSNLSAQEVQDQLTEAHRLARTPELSQARTAAMLRWLSGVQQRLSGKRDP
ncbi:MAG: DUF4350 domain-containing protein [Planctomycetota bacterium]